jgi:hypothetical protein
MEEGAMKHARRRMMMPALVCLVACSSKETDDGSCPSCVVPQCAAAELGTALGHDSLLVGGDMDDASFAAAKPDVRYHYATGGLPAGGPPARCDDSYDLLGESWWGCWAQMQSLPPGVWVREFLTDTTAAGALPLISHYQWYFATGYSEGDEALAAFTNTTLVGAYLADFQFLCDSMGAANVTALLHIEPDLWGFARASHASPTEIPVALSSAGLSVCAGLADNMAGLGQCMLRLVRAKAPKVLAAFHASGWAPLGNTYPEFDLEGDAVETAAFLRTLGAADADFIVVEMANCDAAQASGWWYDDTNATLPNFTQAFTWTRKLSDELALPHLWWQIPYGNMSLDNTPGHFQDNRLDYFFDHPKEFAAAGAFGIVFGSGCGDPTMPDTDGGHFIARTEEYHAHGGTAFCGD